MRRFSSPSALPLVVGYLCSMLLLLLAASPAHAALPPGYEDVMHCPAGYCDRLINQESGMAGPAHIFHECWNPATDDVVDEVWTGDLTDAVAPEGWAVPLPCDTDVPAEITTTTLTLSPVAAPTGSESASGGNQQFGDIMANCQAQIAAGIGCFTTSQEPACEDFDPMSLLAGELPVPDSCDEGAELVCGVLVGCCDQQIVDIAMCAAEVNIGLVCDNIDCSTVTSGGGGRVMTYAYLLGVGLALVGWNL